MVTFGFNTELTLYTLMSKLNLKESKSLFVILALGAVMVMASISLVSPGQLAVAQDGNENSADEDQSEREYKHGDEKDCPFKNKKSSDTSTPEENT